MQHFFFFFLDGHFTFVVSHSSCSDLYVCFLFAWSYPIVCLFLVSRKAWLDIASTYTPATPSFLDMDFD